MVEETKNPSKIFPKVLLTALLITAHHLCSRINLGDHPGSGS